MPPALCVLTPGTLAPGSSEPFARRARALFAAAGEPAPMLVLREPALADRELLALAQALAEELHAAGGELVVHDRVHLARAAGARAVQLGFRSLPPTAARAQLEPAIAVGFSAHAHDEPRAWEGAQRLLCGPVRATESKRGLLEPCGFEGLARVVAAAGARLVWALGGMRPEDALAAREAGAAGLAVLSGLWSAPDPARALARYAAACAQAWPRGGAGAEACA